MDRYNVGEALNVQLGQAGYDIIGSGGTIDQTSNPGVTWVAITVLTGSTDDGMNSTGSITATSVDTDVWDSLSSVTILAGQTIYGRYSTVTVASGDFAMAYRG